MLYHMHALLMKNHSFDYAELYQQTDVSALIISMKRILYEDMCQVWVFQILTNQFSSVQFSSVAQLCLTLWDPMNHSTPGLPVHHRLPEFTQTHVLESLMPSSHLILCRPLLLLPSVFPRIRVFSNELAIYIIWPKFWSFSFSISPSMNIQSWFPLGWTSLISLLSKGLSGVFYSTTV